MTQLLMNDDDDIAIENNKFKLTDHNSDIEISQRLKQRLKFFLNEWFLDLNEGLPWFQIIFQKGTPADVISSLLKNRIITTEGVDTLEEFDPLEFDSSTRLMQVRFKVITINGTELTINEVAP